MTTRDVGKVRTWRSKNLSYRVGVIGRRDPKATRRRHGGLGAVNMLLLCISDMVFVSSDCAKGTSFSSSSVQISMTPWIARASACALKPGPHL
jgi:hypothetical protein